MNQSIVQPAVYPTLPKPNPEHLRALTTRGQYRPRAVADQLHRQRRIQPRRTLTRAQRLGRTEVIPRHGLQIRTRDHQQVRRSRGPQTITPLRESRTRPSRHHESSAKSPTKHNPDPARSSSTGLQMDYSQKSEHPGVIFEEKYQAGVIQLAKHIACRQPPKIIALGNSASLLVDDIVMAGKTIGIEMPPVVKIPSQLEPTGYVYLLEDELNTSPGKPLIVEDYTRRGRKFNEINSDVRVRDQIEWAFLTTSHPIPNYFTVFPGDTELANDLMKSRRTPRERRE